MERTNSKTLAAAIQHAISTIDEDSAMEVLVTLEDWRESYPRSAAGCKRIPMLKRIMDAIEVGCGEAMDRAEAH